MAKSASQSAAAQLYQSLSLPAGSRCIRVLKIGAPSSHHVDGGVLHADICIIDLAATPASDYTALSYVWGGINDAAPTSIITLGADRISVQLTDNCHEALKTLRSSIGSLTIWVDALCINQDDLAERGHQLSLMGDIFSKADITYIWLGPGDEATARAMKCLSTVGVLEYFFSTLQQYPGAHIRPRPFSAAWALYRRRWKHLNHGIRLWFDRDGLKCQACQRVDRNAFMASSGVTHPSVVTTGDLVHFLESRWLYRVWTYQEVMLSENPILVCGEMTMPWWRFAMSILYLRITEHWTDKHDMHAGESTSILFKSLRHWKALILDRNELQMSRRHPFKFSGHTTLDLRRYNRFLSVIADIFMLDYMPGLRGPILRFKLYLCFIPLAFPLGLIIGAAVEGRGFGPTGLVLVALCIAIGMFSNVMYYISRNLDHTIRRPRRRYLRHNPEMWPEESSARNTILSAIWTRQCKEQKDFNFGTRNLMQVLIGARLPHLDVSSPLGEIYRDLTVNLLQLTGSPELVVAALRSHVPGAPSWTVDWFMRAGLRLYPGEFERDHGLFFDPTARPMPQDSWRFDPLQPNVLQVRAWTLGTVTAVLELKSLKDDTEHDQRAEHLHNLEALLRLANAELDSEDWNGVLYHLPWLTAPTLKFFCRNRHMQPERILSLLQSGGRFRLSSASPYASLFKSYKRFCNTMASKQNMRIVVLDGARPFGSDISASHWPSNVSMATCYPISVAPYHSCASPAVQETQFQDCRVQPGDTVLQLCGLREKAVVRQDKNKLIFVDAIEAMGLPILISGWTNACDPSEMPLIDIS